MASMLDRHSVRCYLIPMLELRLLRYFLAIAREGTFTGAAAALHLTQPTLSRQIRELEEAFGKPLFERGGPTLTLTPDGAFL